MTAACSSRCCASRAVRSSAADRAALRAAAVPQFVFAPRAAAARVVAAIAAAPRGAFLAKPWRDGLGGAPHLFAHNAVAVPAPRAAADDADAAGLVVMRVVAPPAHASAVLELPDEADHSPLASPFAPAAAAGAAAGGGTLCAVRLSSRAPRAPSAVRRV